MSSTRPPCPTLPIPARLLDSARKLRHGMTDAENLLWYLLRRKQLGGFRFRRQHPYLGFILDFYCPEARLVVEIDGGQHADNITGDALRTDCLERRGLKVLRFWNNEVTDNIEGVLETIYFSLVEKVVAGRDSAPPP